MQYFRTIFLDDANAFLISLNPKVSDKLVRDIHFAEKRTDPKLFKKLRDEIWEFRLRYGSNQIRVLAFWDKTDKENTLVIATHGFFKKTDKTPDNEIERAKNIRQKYFFYKK